MCKRNFLHKNQDSVGCVRETPQIKMKPARAVWEKLPKYKWSQQVMFKRNSSDKLEMNQHGMWQLKKKKKPAQSV